MNRLSIGGEAPFGPRRAATIVFWTAALAYAAYWLLVVVKIVASNAVCEYRDLVALHSTALMASGINPYDSSAQPPTLNVYGCLYSALCAALFKLSGMPLLALHKTVAAVCIVGASALIAAELRAFVKSAKYVALAFLLGLGACWNLIEFVIRPDSLGLLLCLSALALTRRKDTWPAVAMAALLVVLSFYAKQYFAYSALPIALFLAARRSWAKALAFGAALAAFAAASALAVNALMPEYFYQTIAATAQSATNSWPYAARQTFMFAVYYWPLLLTAAIGGAAWLRRRAWPAAPALPAANGAADMTLYVLALAAAAVCLAYLGQNSGAYLTYFTELALPPLIVVGLAFAARLPRRAWRGVAMLLMVACCMFKYGTVARSVNAVWLAPQSNWDRAERLLDGHGGPRGFLSPSFAPYLIDRGGTVYDNGNLEYAAPLSAGGGSSIADRLFPRGAEISARYRSYVDRLQDMVRLKRFPVIAVYADDSGVLDKSLLEGAYEPLETMPLSTLSATRQYTFWIPK